jgi:PelA/Pel-15E family pectate lyase
MKKIFLYFVLILLSTGTVSAQDLIADNMLLYQRNIGGWPKHIGNVKIDYSKQLSPGEKAGIIDDASMNDATIDNNATSKEIRYLVKAYKKTGVQKYLAAVEKGIHYLLIMQNNEGGWPQFYPDSGLYRSTITFNDNAMINAMNVLWDVVYGTNDFDVVNASLKDPSASAIKKGIECILKTQIRVNGKLTVWCAQYDNHTLQPAKARSYELVSLSGKESVGIVEFLMKIEHPSKEIKTAINAAVQWFRQSRIDGFKYVDVKDATQPNGRDRVLVPEKNSTVWARFYDIETNKPFFSGRDGIKKWSVTEIENERRTGYGWYGPWAIELLEKEYPEWLAKNS